MFLYQYENPYQASTINNQDYTYDLNGNLTDDELQEYKYNYQDRLTRVFNAQQQATSTMVYDNTGQRVYKKVIDGAQQTITDTYYANKKVRVNSPSVTWRSKQGQYFGSYPNGPVFISFKNMPQKIGVKGLLVRRRRTSKPFNNLSSL